MTYRKLEGLMVAMATGPVLFSLSYNVEKIEKAMKFIGVIVTPFGTVATIAALLLLWHSLRKQDEQHRMQIDKMSEQHEEQINNMNTQHNEQLAQMEDQHREQTEQVRRQLLRMETSNREKILKNHIAAISNNVHYCCKIGFEKGIHFIPYKLTNSYNDEETRYVCVVFWNIRYRSEKRDQNYMFDLKFSILQLPTPEDKKMERHSDEELIELVGGKLENSDTWNYSFSFPRFESGYGQIANDRPSLILNKLDINHVEKTELHIIIYSMSKIQSFDMKMMKYCADLAKKVNI